MSDSSFALGQSGARLAVCTRGGERVVVKSATSVTAARLRRQAGLQAQFADAHRAEAVSAPEVLELGPDSFTMSYVDGTPLGEFLLTASLQAARTVSGHLLRWLTENLVQSIPRDHRSALQSKVEALARPDASVYAVPDIDALYDKVHRRVGLCPASPNGPTHGDLSFDNILVEHHSGRLVLVDFLDATVDSPVLDLARLYLDARFAWWASYGRPRNRLLLAGRQLATELEKLLDAHDIDRDFFDGCVALTILRILPYTSNPVRRGLLLDALHRSVPSAGEA